MKNLFTSIAALLSLLWGLPPDMAKAQNSISYGTNSAVITFNIADYTFENSDVNQLNLIDKSFVSITMADDEYGIVADDGYPAIPQLPLLINIPVNAKNVSISMRNAVKTQQQVPTGKYIEPFVSVKNDGTIEGAGFNAAYYNTATTPYVSYFYAAGEPFSLFDEQALDLTILPFQYVPTTGALTVLKSAEFVITWTTEGSAAKGATTQVRDDFFKDVFMSYESRATKGGKKGRLLIITAPQYEQGLSLFKQYKENIGISTQIVSTTTTGASVYNISEYIRTSSFKPDFVLLVGSIGDINQTDGNPNVNDINNPVTDHLYRHPRASLKYGTVFLGRWPVSSKNALANIINKTITMENKLPNLERRVALLSGHGEAEATLSFNKGNDHAQKGFEKHDYQCDKFYQASRSQISALGRTYPAWFIYAGHGEETCLKYFNESSIGSSYFIRNDVFPFVFSFSCLTGAYYTTKGVAGMALCITEPLGPVSYFGSTIETTNRSDEIIEKKILKKSLGQNYLGAIITHGMTKYNRQFCFPENKNLERILYTRSYNLMGDPSLNRLGYDILSTYDFNELFTAISGINLTFNSTNAINIYQGLNMERNASLTLKPTNNLLLKGTIATAGGKLTGESKKVTLDGGARIKSGSVVNLTANEFDFQSGFTIESGSDVVFQVK